jgi:hypothetical protein
LRIEGGKLEYSVGIMAENEDYPAIAEAALSVVEDDGFGLRECSHNHLMPGDG